MKLAWELVKKEVEEKLSGIRLELKQKTCNHKHTRFTLDYWGTYRQDCIDCNTFIGNVSEERYLSMSIEERTEELEDLLAKQKWYETRKKYAKV